MDTPDDSRRAALEEMVEDQRADVAGLVAGLDEELARRRLVPSRTTPLGLVKHLTSVERVWFGVRLSGRTRAELGLPDDVDSTFELGPEDTIDSLLADHAQACEESRRAAATLPLDTSIEHPFFGTIDLHWVYLHLVREIARHLGHGDILREQLLEEAGSES